MLYQNIRKHYMIIFISEFENSISIGRFILAITGSGKRQRLPVAIAGSDSPAILIYIEKQS